MSENDADIFCIDCKFNWNGFCENPKGIYKVKTHYRIEEYFSTQKEQNSNNDCSWFEEVSVYKPKGIFATALLRAYKFIKGDWR